MSATLQTPDWHHPVVAGRMDTSHLMTPPTSAPRVPKPGKEKRLKLRASCDACAASKIRCSKEHPICSRCSANKLQCVYGVSRKHGKPGRKRKRNPDGTPFVKATKNRSCPVNEPGKYGYQFGPQLPQADLEITSNWISDWSPTISLPDTSGFEFLVPSEQLYPDIDCFNANSADTVFMAMSQPEQEPVQAMESSFSYPEPLIENQPLQFDFLNTQNSDNYIGSDWGNLKNYSADITIDTFDSFSSPSSLYSPMSQGIHNTRSMTSSTSITSPSRTCCHGLTCSTFGSTFPWGTSLSSPASDSFCSSSPSISGVISPLLAPAINQDTISNVYMQPSSFSSCEFNDGSQQMGSGVSF